MITERKFTTTQLDALKVVLDFVERYNKNDDEIEAAQASEILGEVVIEEEEKICDECGGTGWVQGENGLEQCIHVRSERAERKGEMLMEVARGN